MKKLLIIPAIFAFAILFTSCYNDSAEALYPELNNMCDTTNVTYSKNIAKIMNNNCNNCHGSTYKTDGNGVSLGNYQDLFDNYDDVLGAVNHVGNFKPMPKNSSKLSSCILRQLQIWNEQGKPNN